EFRLETAKHHGKFTCRSRQHGSCRASHKAEPDSVPLLSEVEGQTFVGAIGGTNPCLVQVPVVIGTKALEEADHEPAILGRSVGELVARPVVFADWNENILVDVEGRD